MCAQLYLEMLTEYFPMFWLASKNALDSLGFFNFSRFNLKPCLGPYSNTIPQGLVNVLTSPNDWG